MAFNIPITEQIRLAVHFVKFKTNQKLLRTSETIITDTTYGKVKGIKWKCLYGERTYLSFEGIPYAKPPLGYLRYKAPIEPQPWNDVRNCKKQRNKPSQFNYILKRTVGSEDCLYLNVYTPELKPVKTMPVLVWVYGGGFQMGETSREIYSPDYFMMESVVLVTIAYRLGALGFLSLKDEKLDVPGNAGLKDQIMALKWVKENCHFFGGDANNVTVFGESAGGASIHLMMLSEQSRGLFQKAIIMSGSALAHWAVVDDANCAFRLAQATGYTGENTDAAVFEHIRTTKTSAICKVSNELLTREEREKRLIFSFAPVVEPYVSDHCVIPKRPVELMRNCWSNKIPLVIGGNSFEGLLGMTELNKYPYLLHDLKFENLPPSDAGLTEEERKRYGELIRQQYFGDLKPSLQSILQYCDLISYRYFWHGIHRTILSRMQYAPNAPTYLYRFDFDSKYFNIIRNMACGRQYSGHGACHADDLSYMFYNGAAKKLKKHTAEYNTIRKLTGMLVYFAESGNPNAILETCTAATCDCPNLWLPVTAKDEDIKCLNISDTLEVIPLPETEKLKLWDLMYENKSLLI